MRETVRMREREGWKFGRWVGWGEGASKRGGRRRVRFDSTRLGSKSQGWTHGRAREDRFPLRELGEFEVAVEETTGFGRKVFRDSHRRGEGGRVALLEDEREEFEGEDRSWSG